MERIMPIDLERAELRKKMRGYDPKQVHDLLQRAANEITGLRAENARLNEALERQRQELESFRAQENTLKEALILAQRTADEARANAHKEASLIVEEAGRKAREVQTDAERKLDDVRWELERLRLEKQKFLNGFRAMLEAQLRDIAETPGLKVVDGEAPDAANG